MNLIALFLAVIALALFSVSWQILRLRKVIEKLIPLRFEIEEGAAIKERLIGVA